MNEPTNPESVRAYKDAAYKLLKYALSNESFTDLFYEEYERASQKEAVVDVTHISVPRPPRIEISDF